jgi:demethylmenaquinone methyltransferase/2-methoxy-6-polyprenyl-1,4-benzoquinol methylase/phosphoethanolamine N-methyltransferase
VLHNLHSQGSTATTHGNVIHWASRYDALTNFLMLGHAPALRENTAGLAGIQPGSHVLDVGCGTGDLTLVAKRRAGPAGKVVGIDASPEMIAVARHKAAAAGAEIEFREAVVEALPFGDRSFDVVLSSLMMHHLPADLKRQALAEIARVLKPGGQLVIVDLVRPESGAGRLVLKFLMHGGLKQGVQDLAEMVRAAGFTRVETGNVALGILGYTRGSIIDAIRLADKSAKG